MAKFKAGSNYASSGSQNRWPSTPARSFSNSCSKPAWLLSTLADLDERMKTLAMKTAEDGHGGESFGERAQSYYQKRPQLLALLQDLYHGYITLSDRYVQTLAKHHPHSRNSSQISAVDHEYCDQDDEDGVTQQIDSDAESSLSFQQPATMLGHNDAAVVDAIVADLVMKNVEYEIMMHEMGNMEQRYGESSRKIELQKCLLEVLESERLILLSENAKLGYRVTTLVEENKGLASESMFMKRKARELANCVLKMREDHRVYMLNRRIEDLQAQIYGLEKRNKEYYEQQCINKQEKGVNHVYMVKEGCFKMEKLSQLLKKSDSINRNRKKIPQWWKKVTKMDLFSCGLAQGCTTS